MKTYGTTMQKQTYKQAVEMRIRGLEALNLSVGRGPTLVAVEESRP